MRSTNRADGILWLVGMLFVLLSVIFYNHILIFPSASDSTPNYTYIKTKTSNSVRLEFVDQEGNPITPFGNYSIIVNSIDDTGKVICEKFYFQDKPVTSSMGQYGNSYEYDSSGNCISIQYIDEKGSPMNGLLGYSTIRRTFNDDGSIREEHYYDIEGNSVKLSSGNSGIRYKNGKIYYLDSSGHVMFNYELFISNNQWVIVVIGLVLCFLVVSLCRNLSVGVIACYVVFIISRTLIRHSETVDLNLNLFWSYKQFFTNYALRIQILNNIWLFIPLGAGIYSILRKKHYLILPFLLSISIETAQYFLRLGLCELDDIVSNTAGGIIGFIIAYQIQKIFDKEWNKKC